MNALAARNRPKRAVLLSMLLLVCFSGASLAAGPGGLSFTPVAAGNDAAATEIKLPKGFQAQVVIRPGDPTADDPYFSTNPDMNVLDPSERFLFTSHEIFDISRAAKSGSLTRTDLKTGVTVTLMKGRRAADGLKWTPWGTLLLGEEFSQGGIWEVNPWSGAHERRDLLGNFAHEGIAIAADGSVYLADEYEKGAVYKFVPKSPHTMDSLVEGQLFVLTAKDGWVSINDPAQARDEALEKGAQTFNRPEDMEIGPDGKVYVTITGEHRVIAIDDSGTSPRVSDYVTAGLNAAKGTFSWPDNLAFDPQGNLYILEDLPGGEMKAQNVTDDVWVATPDRNGDGLADGVYRFAAWASSAVEPSGAVFSADGKTMYINRLEASDATQGAVLKITGFMSK